MKGIFSVIDLFSGCGGMSLGFEHEEFKILLGVDIWGDALKTFKYNHPEAETITKSVSETSAKEILDAVREEQIDVIIGGPPCQGFSLSGPRDFFDKRNILYLDFIKLVLELKPKAFVIENVPGLGSLFGGVVKNQIIAQFENGGYKVSAKVLNAADFGVPQNRKRIFFVGLKSGEAFEFPRPTHVIENATLLDELHQQITVWDAISDLPLLENEIGAEILEYTTSENTPYQKLMRIGSEKIYNHVASKHTEQTKKIIAQVPEGMNYKSLPAELQNVRNFHVAWTRLSRSRPSSTIDTGHRHHFHPIANRVPTVRESARLQSFPDTFKFFGSKTSQAQQVGNAVPPLLASVVGRKLKKYL